MRSASIVLTAALEYAARGWPVMPLHWPQFGEEILCSCGEPHCKKVGKHPWIIAWQNQASTDEATIRDWWRQRPESNVGILCGQRAGFFALDVDGERGAATLKQYYKTHGKLPVGPRQNTGGGGWHLLFQWTPGLKNAVGFADGLDIRTDGGQIVAEPSVHECGKEYEWEPRCHPADMEIPTAPDWLLEEIRKASQSDWQPVPPDVPIEEGKRNFTLFRNGCSMRRRGFGEEAIRAALSVENRVRCHPPLDDDEIADIARKACRYQPEEPPTNGVYPEDRAPLISFPSLNSSGSADVIEHDWPASLAPEAFHGIAGEVVRAIYEESEADEAALLINFLVTFGNAVGRNPHGMAGKTRHGTNLFAGLVGRTGDARKGTSWDPIHDLFERALPVYTREHIQGSVASGEGLISLVRDRHEKRVQIKDKKTGRMTMDYETVVEDEGVDDKRLLIVDSEMSGLLKVMGRTGNILSEQLRKAWETGDLQNLNKTSPLKATGAHISIVGHITPDGLSKHLTEAEAANGFGNRYLWLVVKRSKPLPEGGDIPLLNNYVTEIKQLVELASEKARIGRDADARLMWKAVYDDLTAAGVGMFGELTARRAPIVLRLSLIYALLDGFDIVLPSHLLAALAVWERSEASVRFLFGDATGDPTGDALYEAMINRPEGTTRTDLHAALGRNRPVSEIDRALTALQRAGRARMVRQKSEHNREVEAWHANQVVDHGAKTTGYVAKAKAVLAEIEREHERN